MSVEEIMNSDDVKAFNEKIFVYNDDILRKLKLVLAEQIKLVEKELESRKKNKS